MKNLNKTRRLAVLLVIILLSLLAVGMIGYSQFVKGYAAGIRTKDSHKTGLSQELCFHDWADRSGICMKCGLKCVHPKYDENNNCKVCGFHHVHNFENSVCLDCGAECEHEHWSKGICAECGFACSHETWADDICAVCGIYCKHLEFEEGICTICGSPCVHETWKDGKCTSCGIECRHNVHDQLTGICSVCGFRVFHDYSSGVCSCGLTPPFITGRLPDNILEESSRKGTVQTVTYTTRKYNEDNEVISKNMDVYLPYGYTSVEKYNVLIMIHGTNGQYYEWTNNPITVGDSMSNPRNIYDNMIDQRIIQPLIIVSVSPLYFGKNGETDSGYKQLAPELRNDILPFIAGHYSTYAEGISAKSISNARDHFGIGGEGSGALYAYNCGICDNFDLFSNFACFSGCSDPEKYVGSLNSADNEELSVCCLFMGAGGKDPQRGVSYSGYNAISDSTDRLEKSVNAYYSEIADCGSDWVTWTSLMYDALLVLFPDDPGPENHS